jgi:CRP/FNR family transcriptional regulator, cyclic AMP receptor protein
MVLRRYLPLCLIPNNQREMVHGFDASVFRKGWLSQTPTDFREMVLSRSDLIKLGPGEALYHAGDDAGGLYGVVSGLIELHLHPLGHAPTLLLIVGPGFWTGEFATATGRPRLIALIARSECNILRLSRAEFLRLAQDRPQTWQLLAQLAVGNVERAIMIIAALRQQSPLARLALTLAYLAREADLRPAVLRLTQAELGVLAQMSRGAVNAALAQIEARGLIRREYAAIIVTDPDALSQFSDPA